GGHEDIEAEAERGEGRSGDEPARYAEQGDARGKGDKRKRQRQKQGAATPVEKRQEGEECLHAAPRLRVGTGVSMRRVPAMRQARSMCPATASECVATM